MPLNRREAVPCSQDASPHAVAAPLCTPDKMQRRCEGPQARRATAYPSRVMEKVVLAYSGGLDTSVAIRWINEKYNMDVIAVTVDVGNERDFEVVRQKALRTGAIKAYIEDARAPFAEDFVFPALQAGAVYQGVYPLAAPL